MENLRNGLYIPIVTPFNDTGEINESGLRANIDWFLELGVRGIICTGSTGSFDALSHEEMKKVFKITADQAGEKATVLAGTAATTTRECLELSKFAEAAGVKGVMIVPPYYCLPSKEELFRHYEAIAESVNIPIMVYNNPRRASVDMSPEWLVDLSKRVKGISYVKESSGDCRRVSQILNLGGNQLKVFIGNDDIAFMGLTSGAIGWIAAPANIVPELSLDLIQAVDQGDLPAAKNVFYRLLPLIEFIMKTGQLVSICKAGLDLRGQAGGIPRRPRLPLPAAEFDKFRGLLADLVKIPS